MSDAVVLTVYNRPKSILRNVLSCLRRNDLKDTRVLVIDDGSDVDYGSVRDFAMQYEIPLEWHRAVTLEDRPETYHIDGHNNPAYVNNVALGMCDEWVLMLSSDTYIPPDMLTRWRENREGAMWCPRVHDQQAATSFLTPQRLYPMCWCLGFHKDWAEGGFDEAYLGGMAFEDNDFTARVALSTGSFVLDNRVVAWHQTHPLVAYSDEWKGYKRSELYTEKKWGGIPWIAGLGKVNDPLSIEKIEDGDVVLYGVELAPVEQPSGTEDHLARA